MKRPLAFIVAAIVIGVAGRSRLREGMLMPVRPDFVHPEGIAGNPDALHHPRLAPLGSHSIRHSPPNITGPIQRELSPIPKRAWDAAFLSTLSNSSEGDSIGFALVNDMYASGTIYDIRKSGADVVYVAGQLADPEPGRFFFHRQSMPGVAGSFIGVIEFPSSDVAYRIEPTGRNGSSELVERALKEVRCLQLPLPVENGTRSPPPNPWPDPSDYPERPIPPYQNGVPVLESLPGANAVIYLDFGGGYDSAWGGIAYAKPDVDSAQVRDVWARVTEDFIPFDVNVTTDLAVFQRAPQNSRQHVIITSTTTAAPGQGGLAYIGSFNWTVDIPCWVFTLSGNGCAQACSHEIGHALGLLHQGQEHNGVLHDYYAGHGTGETGWAPIMGLPYYKNVTQWSKGEYLNADNQEDELAIITTRNNNVGFRPDDAGNTLAGSRFLEVHLDGTAHGEGIIEQTADADSFQFVTGGGEVVLAAVPVSPSPNLAVQVALYDAEENLLLCSNPESTLWACLATNLPAGTYTFQVAGAGRHFSLTNGFSSYGSLGYYSITGSVAHAQSTYRFSIPQYTTNGALVGIVGSGDGKEGLCCAICSGDDGHTFAVDNCGKLTLADVLRLDAYAAASEPCRPVLLALGLEISEGSPSDPAVTRCRVLIELDYQPSPPVIRQQPEPMALAAGADAILGVAAVGDAPLSYQWFFDSKPIAGGTSPCLLLNNVQVANAGYYSVSVSNIIGVVTSVTARLSVRQPKPPSIVRQPVDQVLAAGDTVRLTVAAIGTPPLRYQWQKDGATLAGGTTTSLSIANASRRDSGAYAVRVSDDCGSALSRSAAVQVRVPQQLSAGQHTTDAGFVFWSKDFNTEPLLPGDLTNLVLQVSGDLSSWEVLSEQVALTNGILCFRDSDATNHSARFYRVVEHRPGAGRKAPAIPWPEAEP